MTVSVTPVMNTPSWNYAVWRAVQVDVEEPFFRTVAESPALIARAREIASDLRRTLAEELEADGAFDGDATSLATLFAGYSSVMVETARRLMGPEAANAVVQGHRVGLDRLFDVLGNGFRHRP